MNDPIVSGTPYDAYEMKLQTKSVEIVRQMVDPDPLRQDGSRSQQGHAQGQERPGNPVTEDRTIYCNPVTGVEMQEPV